MEAQTFALTNNFKPDLKSSLGLLTSSVFSNFSVLENPEEIKTRLYRLPVSKVRVFIDMIALEQGGISILNAQERYRERFNFNIETAKYGGSIIALTRTYHQLPLGLLTNGRRFHDFSKATESISDFIFENRFLLATKIFYKNIGLTGADKDTIKLVRELEANPSLFEQKKRTDVIGLKVFEKTVLLAIKSILSNVDEAYFDSFGEFMEGLKLTGQDKDSPSGKQKLADIVQLKFS